MLTQILRMAPSAQPRTSRQSAPAPISGSRHIEFRQSARAGDLCLDHLLRSRRRPAEGSERERACIRRQPAIGASGPKTPVRGMAPSSYPRISGQVALAPIAGSCATEFRQIISVEAVAPGPNDGNNAREWRTASARERSRTGGRPAIGAFHPYEVMRQSTRVTENGKKTRVKGIHRDRSIQCGCLGCPCESGHRQRVFLRG